MQFTFVSELELIADCEAFVTELNCEIEPNKKMFFKPVAKYGKSATLMTYYLAKSNTFKALVNTGRAQFIRDLSQLQTTDFDENSVIVFFDDFFGTGGSLIKSIQYFKKSANNSKRKISAAFGACIYYTHDAELNIKKRYPYLKLKGKIHDKYFDAKSINYPTESQMQKCKDLFAGYAQKKRLFYSKGINHKLGYKDSQSNISFPYMPPNNTLPIIWSGKSGWRPLIPRDAENIILEVDRIKKELAYATAKLHLKIPNDKEALIFTTYDQTKLIIFGILRLRNWPTDWARIAIILGLSFIELDKFILIAFELGYLDEANELTEKGKAELNKLLDIITDKKNNENKKLPFIQVKYVSKENSRE